VIRSTTTNCVNISIITVSIYEVYKALLIAVRWFHDSSRRIRRVSVIQIPDKLFDLYVQGFVARLNLKHRSSSRDATVAFI
jgi:hypothetical protein